MLVILLATASATCPDGWMGGEGSKCMKLTAPATHEGCAAACGSGHSLACITSAADKAVADMVQVVASGGVPDLSAFVWTGEYQYPFEPVLHSNSLDCPTPYGCYGNLFGLPYNLQQHWGRCSNGQSAASYTPTILGFSQPNNFNGAEDCMATTLAGPGDAVCSEPLPCLCEYGNTTTSLYLSLHGPALTQRATEATELVYSNLIRTLILAAILGSCPALLVVLVIEGYYVRWQQRVPPTTKGEASLQETVRLGLRRRMLQTGLSLWIGGVCFGLSIPPRQMFSDGSWPNDGVGKWPFGMPIFWDALREPVWRRLAGYWNSHKGPRPGTLTSAHALEPSQARMP